MANESIHKNPQDLVEERFMRMEDQVVDISHNISLLTAALERNLKPFGEVAGSNSETILDEKLGDNKDT
jgi:hypothetical protein